MMWPRSQLGDWENLEQLQRMQRAQLPLVVDRARRSPFYRQRFAGRATPCSADEYVEFFTSLPLTSKQDLRDQYPFGLLAVGKDLLATYHESSGTTGEPTSSYYTAEDWIDLAQRYARKWVGISASDIFLVRVPYALVIAGHVAHAAARLCGATVVPADFRSLATPLPRVVRVLHDLGVTLTWSSPTEALMMAAAARAAGYRPAQDFPALRALFVGGEPLTSARRRRIGEIWGVPVVEEYGSTETGTLAGQCPSGRLHLWADRALFEVYSPATGTLSSQGRGQLVVTPLYAEAMALLRYNLADDVEVSYSGCDCGWLLPTVQVFGRSAATYPVGSTTVAAHQLEQLVFTLPLECEVMFWRAKAEPNLLRVELEVPDEHRRQAVQHLAAAIDREIGVPHEITGLPLGTLTQLGSQTTQRDALKTRSLFSVEEDWNKAVAHS